MQKTSIKSLILSKTDSARRQLETAVRLFFNDGDPVSIHTLACAAHELLSVLNVKQGNKSGVLRDAFISRPFKAEFESKLREAKNFFKHADNDPGKVLKFNPDANDFFLLDACEQYEMLTGEKNPHFVIYRGWFNSKYPHIMNLPSSVMIEEQFGNDKLEFYSRLMAVAVMDK